MHRATKDRLLHLAQSMQVPQFLFWLASCARLLSRSAHQSIVAPLARAFVRRRGQEAFAEGAADDLDYLLGLPAAEIIHVHYALCVSTIGRAVVQPPGLDWLR